MIALLRIFGGIAAIGTAIYLVSTITAFGAQNTAAAWPCVQMTIISLGLTILWFWLAAKLAARRRAKWAYAMSLPCQQCGSNAARGYRICSSCGRVKAAGL